ncbi:MAG: sulfate ABC transporter permease subunit CysW [Methylocystis sp.]|jgi:sulfate transport system permease protein|nr:sulfate ABC transporter permease subunit CysW [Methylocystis sp.]MCA3582852.1 sulfate ABC transporter permease subunit CysW [Methylocystis sp.]MCA3589077.1 sulfate ABC transporter permease subunit CysW [Methylocystis sp.]MCA3590611.1 sulfate ABC transporter permease subunit CysW [Methylocystis sp.]
MSDASLAADALPVGRPTGHRTVARGESAVVRVVLIGVGLGFLALFLALPLAIVFLEAFARGWGAYRAGIADPDSLSAIQLTLLVAAITIPINVVVGIAGAWAVAKHEFRGKSVLVSLIDLPFSVSPVIAGLVYVLLFGAQGYLGPFLKSQGLQIIFALPGIVLATLFVTFPFIARELIPHMQALGNADEEAALTLGASPWRTFLMVTLPNIKWSLLYGVLLCNARAMGEFGAVAVVSGKIRGLTTTMPLHVEILYNEYMSVAAFAVASLLALLALVTLAAKTFLEWRYADEIVATRRH